MRERLKQKVRDKGQHVNEDLYQVASAMMSPEQIKRYKDMGDEMYADVDFDSSNPHLPHNDNINECIAYIKEGLKSGLHPSSLSSEEISVMETYGGERWFEEFGFASL